MVRMATHASPTSRNIIRSRPAARPDFLHVSVARRHIDKLAARPTVRRRQARNMYNAPTTSDLGRPTRTRLSACIMVRMATHTGRFCMYASPTSRNMVRSRPAARPDFLHVSVARRHIDKPAARPSMQSPPAPPPDYGCFRTYASSTSRNMVRSRPPDPNPTFCMYHG